MPIFSLPSKYGIGTFGAEAYRFVDFLEKAGQSYWQILPLNPTNYGDSPYQSFSSFAGNPYFIDLELLIEEGLLTKEDADTFEFGEDSSRVDYGLLYRNRLPLLKKAANRFVPTEDYTRFCTENAFWLEEYALFMTLKEKEGGRAWQEWKPSFRNRNKSVLTKAVKQYAETLSFYRFVQYQFSRQWRALKRYANQKGIQIIGDLPIYVALDSADTWAEPTQFLLEDGVPSLVAGCPPDTFSADGQKWGNPLYDWDKMKVDSYRWWKRRIRYAFSLYDVLRIDHFRGFESFYAVPFEAPNARNGKWIKGPGMALFSALQAEFSSPMPIIAEDLGFLTESVKKLLDDTGFPGMKVLQFAFSSNEDSGYLPHNYPKNCVVYTGTHDNDTVLGWMNSAPDTDIRHALDYIHPSQSEGFNWSMIRLGMMSVADTAIFMMPDLLALGSEGRINTPSTLGNNWNWRIDGTCINDWLAHIMYDCTALYGRLPKKESKKEEASE